MDPVDPEAVEAVVVTAARTALPRSAIPATVELITPAELRAQTALGAGAVEAVAALIPSFSPTREKLSGFGETLRGRSPLFLVDGVPQSTPLRDDSRDGFTIDPFFIDRVEVIFGSNAIQGIGATGGVINYVTARPAADVDGWTGRVLGQVTVDDGEAGDSLGYKAAARAGRDFGRFDLLVGAAYEVRGAYYDAAGRRIGFDGAQGELQDTGSRSLFMKGGFDLNAARRFELTVNRFELEGEGDYVTVAGDRARGLPTTAVRGAPRGEIPFNDVTTASLTYTDAELAGGRLRAQAFLHDYQGVFGGGTFAVFQDPAIAPRGTLFDQSANSSEKLGFKLDYSRAVPGVTGLRALLGLDLLRDLTFQSLILTDRLWVPEIVFTSAAPFVQLNQALADGRVNLSGGLRHERARLEVDDFFTLAFYGPQSVSGGRPEFQETLLNAGVTVELVPGATAYAAFTQGFNVADLGRVLRAVDRPGQDVDTFLDLTPVVSDNYELGIDVRRGSVEASAALFRSTSDRGSLLVLRGDVFEVQRQRTEIEGLELSARWTATEFLTLGGAYAHLRGRTDANGDGSVDRDLDGANISPDRLLLYAEARRGPWSGRLQGQSYFSRDFEGADPRNRFDGYRLADATLTWAGPVMLSLGVRNLFDEQYVSYNSDVTGPTDNLGFFAGRGRTLTLGLQKDF